MYKTDYSWNPGTGICEDSKYLKIIFYNKLIVCNKIVSVSHSVSTNVTTSILSNLTSTVSVKSDDTKVKY